MDAERLKEIARELYEIRDRLSGAPGLSAELPLLLGVIANDLERLQVSLAQAQARAKEQTRGQ